MANEVMVFDSRSTAGYQTLFGGRNPKDSILVNGKMMTMGQVDKVTREIIYINQRGRMVSNSMLTRDEWRDIEGTVIMPGLYPLNLVSSIRAKGLVKKLGSIGSLVSMWSTMSEVGPATVNMTGQGYGNNDLPDMGEDGVPIPVIFKPYHLDWRQLAASRTSGDGLDMTSLWATTRVVNEELENMTVNGASVKVSGFSLYGLRTHPGRATGSAAGDFGTIGNILPTINAMVHGLQYRRFYGKYTLYVSQDQFEELNNQYYGTDSNITPLSRIRENQFIDDVQFLPTEVLPAGELLLVQMTPDVIDIAEALPVQVREWASGDGMQMNFKVLTIAAPRIKARKDGYTGVSHYSGA